MGFPIPYLKASEYLLHALQRRVKYEGNNRKLKREEPADGQMSNERIVWPGSYCGHVECKRRHSSKERQLTATESLGKYQRAATPLQYWFAKAKLETADLITI